MSLDLLDALAFGCIAATAIILMINAMHRVRNFQQRLKEIKITTKYKVFDDVNHTYTCYLSADSEDQSLIVYSSLQAWIRYYLPKVNPKTITVILHKKTSFKLRPIVKFPMIWSEENYAMLENLGFATITEEYLPWHESKREKLGSNKD